MLLVAGEALMDSSAVVDDEARKWLVAAIGGKDLPIALLEDVIAIVLGLVAVSVAL